MGDGGGASMTTGEGGFKGAGMSTFMEEEEGGGLIGLLSIKSTTASTWASYGSWDVGFNSW